MPRPDDERRDDFTATSESLEADAERLLKIENRKQGLDAADPLVDALSIEAERLAGQIQQKSRIERALADDVPDGAEPAKPSN